MIAKFLKSQKKYGSSKKDPPTLAAAALLFKLAAADGRTEKLEVLHLSEILRKEFKLTTDELKEVLALTKDSKLDKSDLESLATQIKDAWGNARRVQLLEYLWVLAYSDDRIDTKETTLISQMAELLRLNEGQQVSAQESAEQRLGLDQF